MDNLRWVGYRKQHPYQVHLHEASSIETTKINDSAKYRINKGRRILDLVLII